MAESGATIVLVHGAWADSSSWDGEISRLRADGYPVVAPANPLRTLSGDAAYIAGVLKTIKGPIVLVGQLMVAAVFGELAADYPSRTEFRSGLAATHHHLGGVFHRNRRPAPARATATNEE